MNPKELIQKSKILLRERDIEDFIGDLAIKINTDFEYEESDIVLLCVMNGGLMFTTSLMKYLEIPVLFDYCQVSRYGKEEFGGSLEWKRTPELSLRDKIVIICDDILDEGITLQAIKEYCEKMGAKETKTAVLFNKIRDGKMPIQADYVGYEIEDVFIFGYGLDYKGYYRNLPDIRYVP